MRVVIAEDSVLLRSGVQSLLADVGIETAAADNGDADLPVLVVSQYAEGSYAVDLIAEGTSGVGYLLKERVADVAEFLKAVRRVAGGGSAIDPDVVAQMLSRSRDPLDSLTARETEVLSLMAQGLSNAAIAKALAGTRTAASARY
ncbi:LuxR C-terminal-related transcriptional regulator [Amycolatopsis panacis]|uniref:LuxR C-terminal-related transcriptional regulator n=1 Tax=Amycolatopsis panacis TaxID=2340917 RepID=UPI0018F4705F